MKRLNKKRKCAKNKILQSSNIEILANDPKRIELSIKFKKSQKNYDRRN